MPLLQPLALSAGTRRAVARQDGLLTKTRAAAAAASGREDQELARIQRVRPRTLLAIAAAAGAFLYLLPQLAQVSSSWRAVQSANWAWVPLVIALSAATYLASAAGLIGAVPQRIRFWPTVLTQGASSFVNRVSPANVGGMALNARYLQKSGVEAQRRRRRGRSQQPGRRHRAPGFAGGLLHLVRPRARQRLQAALEQQATADTRHRQRGHHRHRAGDPSGPPARRGQADPRPEVGRGQPAAGGAEPGQDDPAVRGWA